MRHLQGLPNSSRLTSYLQEGLRMRMYLGPVMLVNLVL